MFYKISNTASEEALEKTLQRTFKYPGLMEKRVLINGFEEATIPIVSMDSTGIVPAIWGILPEGYTEDWQVFQNMGNTLNWPMATMDTNLWYAKSLLHKRCLIPVTGFFTSYLYAGVVYPFYFTRIEDRPFCLAGIYTVTEDGFITCSILTCNADERIKKVHNLGKDMPVILGADRHEEWLQENLNMKRIQEIAFEPDDYHMRCHPIAKGFFDHNISYKAMLDPVFYDNVPVGFF